MTLPLLPAPDNDAENRRREDEEPRHERQQQSRARDNDRQQRVLSEDECLAGLSNLSALLVSGMLTPPQADVYKRQPSPGYL